MKLVQLDNKVSKINFDVNQELIQNVRWENY